MASIPRGSCRPTDRFHTVLDLGQLREDVLCHVHMERCIPTAPWVCHVVAERTIRRDGAPEAPAPSVHAFFVHLFCTD